MIKLIKQVISLFIGIHNIVGEIPKGKLFNFFGNKTWSGNHLMTYRTYVNSTH